MEFTEGQSAEATQVRDERQAFNELSKVANELIIGQERLMERLVMALLCNGHLLVEGAPGLA